MEVRRNYTIISITKHPFKNSSIGRIFLEKQLLMVHNSGIVDIYPERKGSIGITKPFVR